MADKFLETYAEVISGQNLTEEIWPIITCKFPANELISLVEEYSGEQYCWDYAHMYELTDFPAKEYIEQHTENVRWAEFSASAAANRLFSKTGANKTQSLWLRIYEDILNNDSYQWDFNKLTKQPNILKLPKLFLQKKNGIGNTYLNTQHGFQLRKAETITSTCLPTRWTLASCHIALTLN